MYSLGCTTATVLYVKSRSAKIGRTVTMCAIRASPHMVYLLGELKRSTLDGRTNEVKYLPLAPSPDSAGLRQCMLQMASCGEQNGSDSDTVSGYPFDLAECASDTSTASLIGIP